MTNPLGQPQDLPDTSDLGFSFDSLLSEAKALKADTDRLKECRKAIKENKPMASGEYTQLLSDIKRIEAAREWLPVADVAMFQIQHCQACDNYAPLFTGLFQQQRHRHLRGSHRWLAATASENRGLPKKIKTTQREVPFCHFCVEDFGYPIEQLGIEFDTPAPASNGEATEELADDEELSTEEQAQLDFEEAADAASEELQLPVAVELFV